MTHPPQRTPEQLRRHYDIERELADRLRAAPAESRGRLYAEVYDELFRRVTDHPQLVRRADPEAQRLAVEARAGLVERVLAPGGVFLEVGPGDCSLSIRMCQRASQVYAVDVSTEITGQLQAPPNFKLLLSTGTNLPVPDNSMDVAFSFQLIEHLHPADATEHLREVHRALRPGGVYLCVTPNRLNGPHDISRFFDDAATGFHMKEYTNAELSDLFRSVGFRHANPLVAVSGRQMTLPVLPFRAIERGLGSLPRDARRSVASVPGLWRLLGVTMLGTK